ncbi:YdcH family protein [Pannonibacter phragmitetus]|uniref:YdcH family protein n=1 Tax=Pannonibacter phragmitetus TaxID=121719 RepID=UPI003D2EE551
MSMQSHLAELERRHAALDEEIETALRHPSVDTLELAEMKRKKLKLKDEILKIQSKATMH